MKTFDFVANEHAVLKNWDAINILERIVKKNRGGQRFSSLDGPITANAPMGVHHAWSRTLKDSQIKYNILKGRSNQFQNGFDAQGMWVEVEVEKALGLKSKKDIEKFGLGNFTEKCIERVQKYSAIQTQQSKRLGQIMDWENSYFTNSDHNIESIWHFLKVVHDKGWLKKSYKAMPWCPRCGTSLSEHEMSGQYKEVTHEAVFAKLKLSNSDSKILIWTTTPWTLSANVAVAVNPENDYIKASVANEEIIVGKEALNILGKEAKVLEEFKGSKLVGCEYERPMNKSIGKIIEWDEVSATEGSGLVHIAPGCGAEDFALGQKFGLEPIIPVDEAGVFYSSFGKLAGLTTVDATPVIFDLLKSAGQLYKTHKYSHNYPFCWRCKTDVIFRLVEGWDIATADIKPAIFKAIKNVKWHPGYLEKNMVQWITQMGDWNISRRRFYGLPLPFYPCECGHLTVVDSKETLKKVAVDPSAVGKVPHLHRPYIDEVKVTCQNAKCKRAVSRVPDVGDCWLDAGITPFSTKKYFTDRKFWQDNFPSEVVIEMKEQIRLWFYAQLFMSVVLTGKAPYENVVGFNTMLAEDGRMFSKTGFHIPFDEAAETYGADAIRYVCAGANPSRDMLFGPNIIAEAKRKLLSMQTCVSFYTTYATIDKPNLDKHKPSNLHVTDIWLLESLNKFVMDTDLAYSTYQTHLVPALVEAFIEDLSNFYIRTNRRRFWKGESGTDKLNAYWVLQKALEAVAIILSPITPFLAENLYKSLGGKKESVLLADFPTPIKIVETIPNILPKVEFIKRITTLAHSLRASQELKVRQPLRTLFIKANQYGKLDLFEDYLKEELNVKNIELVKTEEQFNIPYLIINFKEAGKALGKTAQELKTQLGALSDTEMQAVTAQFEKGKVVIGGKVYPANLFERKLKSRPEFVSETDNDITVVLDTTLDDELIEEGKLRDIIRQIQVARQDANLEITKRIKLVLDAQSNEIKKVTEKFEQKIATEVLAHSIDLSWRLGAESNRRISVLQTEALPLSNRANDILYVALT